MGWMEGKRAGAGPGESGTRDASHGLVRSLPARAAVNFWLTSGGLNWHPPCQSGTQLWNSGFFADIDECADADACGEAHCRNLPGSYSCLCDEGYAFSSQEKACRGTCPQLPQVLHTYMHYMHVNTYVIYA